MIHALGIDILARVIFDQFGDPYSTNWCIFIHFFDYTAWAFVYLHVTRLVGMPFKLNSLLDRNRKKVWYLAMAMSIYYMAQSFIEITYINESWDNYNEGVFQEGYVLKHSFAIIMGIAFFYYFKILKKKN